MIDYNLLLFVSITCDYFLLYKSNTRVCMHALMFEDNTAYIYMLDMKI